MVREVFIQTFIGLFVSKFVCKIVYSVLVFFSPSIFFVFGPWQLDYFLLPVLLTRLYGIISAKTVGCFTKYFSRGEELCSDGRGEILFRPQSTE